MATYNAVTYNLYLASSYRPGMISSPRRAINVSRPHERMYPTEKWGSPAANVGANCFPSKSCGGSLNPGERCGRGALFCTAVCCTDPKAKAFTKLEPFCTNVDMCVLQEKKAGSNAYTYNFSCRFCIEVKILSQLQALDVTFCNTLSALLLYMPNA